MNINDLIQLYNDKKKQYGKEAYRYLSQILKERQSYCRA